MDEYRDVESTTRFDGYIFVAHNWNMLKGTDLQFRRGFVVRKTTPTELKGVTALQNENGVIAHIGDFSTSMQFMVAVLVTGEITETGMEIERIRSAYIESVDTAVESLTGRWGSRTRSQNLHAHCHNFKARCDNLCDKCKYRAYVVHRDEVGEFGNAFQNLLKKKLADLRYKVCLIVWKFGQDDLLDHFWEWNRFSLEHASELILHLARDFKETNKCLLWKEKDLEAHRLRNTANETKFFRNFLVGGHVHMMYDASQPKDSQTRPVGLFPNKTGVVEIVTLKFYTRPFKVMHQGNEDDSMWRRPKVQEALTVFPCKTLKKPKVDNYVLITNILKYVQCTRNIRESLGNSHGNEARVEAVLILKLDPNARLGREDILKQFLQFFDDQVGPGQMRHLSRFKHEDFVQQIDNTIMAAVNTLEPILLEAQRRRLRMGEEYLSAVPDICKSVISTEKHLFLGVLELFLMYIVLFSDDLQLALACEAIISFGVYGILSQYTDGIRFNEVLKEELKLQPAVYRNCVPFGGLDLCPAANLVNGLVVYTGQLTIHNRGEEQLDITASEEVEV